MRRRDVIKLLGGATVTWRFAARAQQPGRGLRIGVLMSLAHDDRQGQRYVAAFLDRLQELGWKWPDLTIDIRWGAADLDHIRSYAAEFAAARGAPTFTRDRDWDWSDRSRERQLHDYYRAPFYGLCCS